MMKNKKKRKLLITLFAICCCMQTSLLAGSNNTIGGFVTEYGPVIAGVMVGSHSVIIKSNINDDASKLFFELIVIGISVYIFNSMKNELKNSKNKIKYFIEYVIGIGLGFTVVRICDSIRSIR